MTTATTTLADDLRTLADVLEAEAEQGSTIRGTATINLHATDDGAAVEIASSLGRDDIPTQLNITGETTSVYMWRVPLGGIEVALFGERHERAKCRRDGCAGLVDRTTDPCRDDCDPHHFNDPNED